MTPAEQFPWGLLGAILGLALVGGWSFGEMFADVLRREEDARKRREGEP